MKRLSILAVIVTMLGTGLGSCKLSRKLDLETDIDSLSYFYGMSQSEDIIRYLTEQVGVDTTYMDAFYKGYKEGAKNYSPKEIAYLEGKRLAQMINYQIAENLNNELFLGDPEQTINRKALLAGTLHGIKNNDNAKTYAAKSFSQNKMETVREDYRKTKFAEYITTGEQFLADNKNKPGVITTESGLQYKIITEGTGPVPDDRSWVKVHYRGTLLDGTEFDSSYKNNAPTTFHILGVIPGWIEALKMMPVGSKWELYVPNNLAYGPIGQTPIPPYATLIFEIELLEIEAN